MKVRFLAVTAIVAALYIAVTLLVAPFGFTQVQFRISEMFNHLVAFHPSFAFAIVIGVFIANLFSPLGVYDLVFGVGHSVISLAIVIFTYKYVQNIVWRLVINSFVFTFMMWIIGLELYLALDLPFLWMWLTTAAGELAVLAIGAPIMYHLNKRLQFKNFM